MDTVTLSERLSPREMTPEEKLVAVDKALVLSLVNFKPEVYISHDEYVDMFRHILFLEEEIRDMEGDRKPWKAEKHMSSVEDVVEKYNIRPEQLTPPARLPESYIGAWTPSRVKGTYFREGVAPDGSKFTEVVASAHVPYGPRETINSHEAN